MSLPKMCPLCNYGSESLDVITKHIFGDNREKKGAFFNCKNCEVIFQFPQLTAEEEEFFYKKEFETFMDSRSGESGGWLNCEAHIKANEKTRSRRMEYLSEFLPENGKILEIGCSSGFMLHPLIESGMKCDGIEPSGVFSSYLAEKGLKIYSSIEELKKKKPNQKYDLIMDFFVLEHIADPLRFLIDKLDLLADCGKIVFEIPNYSDPLYSIFDIPEFEKFYWSIAHPWYFNEKSLTFLLNQTGEYFELFFDQRYDLSNHIVWARDGKPGGSGRFSDFFDQEFNEIYRKNCIKTKKCDTLIGVIHKGKIE